MQWLHRRCGKERVSRFTEAALAPPLAAEEDAKKGGCGVMRRIRFGLFAPMAAFAIAGTGVAARAYDAVAVRDGGTISGTIKLSGAVPPATTIKVTKHAEQCGPEVPYEALIVGADKGIKNVVVWITEVTKGKAWSAKAVIDQRKCHFRPHVAVAQAGTEVEILNSDGILHNFHTYSTRNPSFNKAQPKFRPRMTAKFAVPEIIKVTCDDHPWMKGWLVVSEHPYVAVTDDRGSFRLTDVPAGTYRVEIWHETLGVQVKTVSVRAKAEAKLNAEFTNK